MRWFDSITNSMDRNLNKLRKIVEGKGAWLFLILHNTSLSACGQAYLGGRHRPASLTKGLFVYSVFKIITFAAPPRPGAPS